MFCFVLTVLPENKFSKHNWSYFMAICRIWSSWSSFCFLLFVLSLQKQNWFRLNILFPGTGSPLSSCGALISEKHICKKINSISNMACTSKGSLQSMYNIITFTETFFYLHSPADKSQWIQINKISTVSTWQYLW